MQDAHNNLAVLNRHKLIVVCNYDQQTGLKSGWSSLVFFESCLSWSDLIKMIGDRMN